MRLSIVIPAYNEAKTVAEIIRRVRAAPICGLEREIVVVDDCSTDGTTQIVESYAKDGDVRVVLKSKNEGKGAALRDGFMIATGEIILVQDSDLEYDPDEYPVLLRPILEGHADVVYGSRFLGGPHRVLYFWHAVGNRLLTLLSNMSTDLNLTDMETCYKVFRAEVIKSISLESDRFGFEPEVTAKVARLGCRVYEVPISYHGRTYAEGKKIGWKDGLQAISCILRYGVVDRLRAKSLVPFISSTSHRRGTAGSAYAISNAEGYPVRGKDPSEASGTLS
jgi:glycosyltransferase involved in cell wall biosynthesis